MSRGVWAAAAAVVAVVVFRVVTDGSGVARVLRAAVGEGDR